LLAQGKHNIARAEAVAYIFRGFKDFVDAFDA
jgi:hypothetical protein